MCSVKWYTNHNLSSFDNCNQENQIAWKDPAPFLQFLKVTCNRATVNWDIFTGCKILQISCILCNFLFFFMEFEKKIGTTYWNGFQIVTIYLVAIYFVLIKFANFFIVQSFPYLQCMAAYIILIYLSFFRNLQNYK